MGPRRKGEQHDMDAIRSQTSPHLNRTHLRQSGLEEDAADGQAGFSQEQEPQRDCYQQACRHAEDLGEEEEQAEGERQQEELLKKHPLWPCPRTAELLDSILSSLLAHSRRPEVVYEFQALDSGVPFASSCSHGAVYFSRALLEGLSRPSLVFFAAHEMAHTELRHFATRQRRLAELRRSIPAAPGSAARQRMELSAVLAVRHQEELEADHLAARWLDFAGAHEAVRELHEICRRLAPESLNRPTHPPFERRLKRLAEASLPPDPVEYLWALAQG
jgi:predicted Zn-dependent protease